jgi:hypothetical protein
MLKNLGGGGASEMAFERRGGLLGSCDMSSSLKEDDSFIVRPNASDNIESDLPTPVFEGDVDRSDVVLLLDCKKPLWLLELLEMLGLPEWPGLPELPALALLNGEFLSAVVGAVANVPGENDIAYSRTGFVGGEEGPEGGDDESEATAPTPAKPNPDVLRIWVEEGSGVCVSLCSDFL